MANLLVSPLIRVFFTNFVVSFDLNNVVSELNVSVWAGKFTDVSKTNTGKRICINPDGLIFNC